MTTTGLGQAGTKYKLHFYKKKRLSGSLYNKEEGSNFREGSEHQSEGNGGKQTGGAKNQSEVLGIKSKGRKESREQKKEEEPILT